MHKNKIANSRLIQNIESKVTTELKLVKKVSSELFEAQQTYHDAVLKVCTLPLITIVKSKNKSCNNI